MTTKDKLAEEILSKHGFQIWLCAGDKQEVVRTSIIEPIIEAMQAYHEAKLKEIAKNWNDDDNFICVPDVTDADIEDYAETFLFLSCGEQALIIAGAKAILNGEIKHDNRSN